MKILFRTNLYVTVQQEREFCKSPLTMVITTTESQGKFIIFNQK